MTAVDLSRLKTVGFLCVEDARALTLVDVVDYRAALAFSYLAQVNEELPDRGGVKRAAETGIALAERAVALKSSVSENYRILALIDVTERARAEREEFAAQLRDKDLLLKELQHRVKNNLQIVSSLLKLQSENVLDNKFLDLITDSRNRINSMALVHEMLYSSRDLGRIEISEDRVRVARRR